MGTSKSAGSKAVASSKGAKHGPATKNHGTPKRKGNGMPAAPTGAIKGRDRGTG